MKARMIAALSTCALFLASCEDEGNPGDDNLLTGASLVILVLVVIGVVLWARRRR